jgi:hypothetical protein
MSRKLIAALLLPVPFAALPVIVVVVGAVFGSSRGDELVTRENADSAIEQLGIFEALTASNADLTLTSSQAPAVSGCDDADLLSES